MNDQPRPMDESSRVIIARPVGYAPLPRPQLDMELPDLSRRDALLDLIIVLLVTLLPYVPGLLLSMEAAQGGVPQVGAGVVAEQWCEAVLGVGLVVYFVLRHRLRAGAFGLRRDHISQQVLWGIGALCAMYVVLLASSVFALAAYMFSPDYKEELSERLKFVDAMPVHSLAITLFLLVAVAVHEEVVFRGLLMPYLRRVSGSWWWAGLCSATIFALLHIPHQGLVGGAQIFGVGVMLCLFFVVSRSLIAVVLAHLAFDFLQFQIVRIMPNLQDLLERLQP